MKLSSNVNASYNNVQVKAPIQRDQLNFDISRLTKNSSMGSLLARAKQNQIMKKQMASARNPRHEISKDNDTPPVQDNTMNIPQQHQLPPSSLFKGNNQQVQPSYQYGQSNVEIINEPRAPQLLTVNASTLIKNQYSSLTFNPHVPKFKNFPQASIEVSKCTQNYFIKNSYAVIEYAYKEDQNRSCKEEMEDKGKSIDNFNNSKTNIIFELFDGHGGDYVAKYLQQNFDTIYRKNLSLTPSDIEDALRTSFFEIDDKLNSLHTPDVGSTGCVVHVVKPSPYSVKVYCANVGDTRCSLISPTKIKRLSYDHRACDPKERDRVISLGGTIKNDRVDGTLMLTRVFGDFDLKTKGVTCSPDITCTNINVEEKNQYLIIACDGIWDILTEDDVRQIVMFGKNTAEDICREIMKKTLLNNAFDNLSLFVVKLT